MRPRERGQQESPPPSPPLESVQPSTGGGLSSMVVRPSENSSSESDADSGEPISLNNCKPLPLPSCDMNQHKNSVAVVALQSLGTRTRQRSCVAATRCRIFSGGNLQPRDPGGGIRNAVVLRVSTLDLIDSMRIQDYGELKSLIIISFFNWWL